MAKKTIAQWITAFGGWIVQNFPSVQTGGIVCLRDFYAVNPEFASWFDANMAEEEFVGHDREVALDVTVEQISNVSGSGSGV